MKTNQNGYPKIIRKFRGWTNRSLRILLFFFSIVFIFIFPLSAVNGADVYTWKDKNGNVVFSDVPPPPGVNAEIKEMKEEAPKKQNPKESIQNKSIKPVREKRSYGDIKAIIYMTSWCPYCTKARNYLLSLGVDVAEYNIERDQDRREEMHRKGGSGGVPFIDIEGIIIRGYSPDALKNAVEQRRNI